MSVFLLTIMSHIFHFPWVFQVFSTKVQISLSFPWDFHNFSNSLSFPGLWPPCQYLIPAFSYLKTGQTGKNSSVSRRRYVNISDYGKTLHPSFSQWIPSYYFTRNESVDGQIVGRRERIHVSTPRSKRRDQPIGQTVSCWVIDYLEAVTDVPAVPFICYF